MKKILVAAAIAGGALIISSCQGRIAHDKLTTGTIVRDCSGTYVQFKPGEDYHVCNIDLLKDKKEGEKITFTYEKTTECSEMKDLVVCMLYHENKGMIRIKSLH